MLNLEKLDVSAKFGETAWFWRVLQGEATCKWFQLQRGNNPWHNFNVTSYSETVLIDNGNVISRFTVSCLHLNFLYIAVHVISRIQNINILELTRLVSKTSVCMLYPGRFIFTFNSRINVLIAKHFYNYVLFIHIFSIY